MQNLELSFASQDTSLSVRSFSVTEALSAPFGIGVVAVSPADDLDLEAFVGLGASLRLGASDSGATRAWAGICNHMEQVTAESSGLTTYYLRIVPQLWRATRRKNNRIFQHLSAPEIALALLADWAISPTLELDPKGFPRFEYRVQYAETDLAFLSRILEEAGIAYAIRDPDPKAPSGGDASSRLVLSTELHRGEARAGGPLLYFASAHPPAGQDVITSARLTQELRPGRLTLRDYDFRSRPDLELLAQARSLGALEDRLEIYEYTPGAFVIEPPDGSPARVDERESKALAERRLAAARSGRREVSFQTTVLDLAPGAIFSMNGHPRRDLDQRLLLVAHQSIEGTRDGEWTIRGRAAFADEPWRPALGTPKPRIPGVQSALVVGPPGAEIHADELGRVRVQFHWDREGRRDDASSCFLRVSQAWAGRGYGIQALPRVGDEVLVGFFDGDPDQPVVVGRVHNSSARTPSSLPQEKTKTSWKSESSPGGGGWNELTFDDAKGQELVYLRAERDHERLVQMDERATIGGALTTAIGAGESRTVTGDQAVAVGGSRSSHVTGSETIAVGESYKLSIGSSGAGVAIHGDGRIALTTGQASIVLDGPNIYFDSGGTVRFSAAELIALGGGEVHIDGKPNVYLNSGAASAPGPIDLESALHGLPALQLPETPEEQQLASLLASPVEAPGAAPEALTLPAFVDEQLKAQRDAIAKGVDELTTAVKDRGTLFEDTLRQKAIDLKENLVPRVEAARREAYARIDALRGQLERVKGEAAARIAELKARAAELRAAVESRIQAARDLVEDAKARARALVDQIQARIQEVRDQARAIVDGIKQRIADVRAQAKQVFDDLKQRAIAVRDQVQSEIDQVKGAIQGVRDEYKQIVSTVKDTIEQAKNEVKQVVGNVKGAIEDVKKQVQQVVGEVKTAWKDAKTEAKEAWSQARTEVKNDVNEIKQEAKDLKQQAKDTWNQAKTEVKDDVKELKQEAKDLKQQGKDAFNQAKNEVKDDVKELKQEAKDLKQQGKDALNQAKTEVKDDVQGLKQEAKDLKQQGKDALNQAKGEVKDDVQGLKQDAKGLGDTFKAHKGLGGGGAPASTIVTRAGGFGGEGVAHAVNGTSGATFLQSPSEGQLMVVRTQASTPLTPAAMSSRVVEHQMQGLPASEAFASVLGEHGYAIYERPWEAEGGEFVKKAVL